MYHLVKGKQRDSHSFLQKEEIISIQLLLLFFVFWVSCLVDNKKKKGGGGTHRLANKH